MTIERYTHHIEYALRRKYFTNRGRANFAQFWCFISGIVIFLTPGVLLMVATDNVIEQQVGRYVTLFLLAFFCAPVVNAVIRRMHDTNRSGMVAVRLMGTTFLAAIMLFLSLNIAKLYPEHSAVMNVPILASFAVGLGSALWLLYLLILPSYPDRTRWG